MYKIDIKNKNIIPLKSTTFSDQNLKERYDIQEWVEKYPVILEEDLLIIQKEYILPSNKRLDLLALDKQGNLVIIELKRDNSGDAVEWQSIKYASYCSRFSPDDILAIFSEYLEKNEQNSNLESPLSQITDFIDCDINEINNQQRIILVSGEFSKEVASAVFWLREYNIDIKCVKFMPSIDTDGVIFLETDVIIPLKETSDYIESNTRKTLEKRIDTHIDREYKSLYFSNPGNYDNETLRKKLTELINLRKDNIVGLIPFLHRLLSNTILTRDELVHLLEEHNLTDAGRKANKVSQILTRKNSEALRQIISFDGNVCGARKDNFKLNEGYTQLLGEVLENFPL